MNATEDDRERCRQIADDLDHALNPSPGPNSALRYGTKKSANLTELLHSWATTSSGSHGDSAGKYGGG